MTTTTHTRSSVNSRNSGCLEKTASSSGKKPRGLFYFAITTSPSRRDRRRVALGECWTFPWKFPLGHIAPPGHPPLRRISLSTWDISPAVKAKIWKLALYARTPNPNRPTIWGPDPNSNSNPNRLTGWGLFFKKVALTYIPDPNRSTTINFVDVNGKPIYIVDWCMVVMEGGNVLHCVKWSGNCPGGEMSGENMFGGNISRGKCPDSL